jgi:RNA 3'-terminal phosphate cyclase (ATP)
VAHREALELAERLQVPPEEVRIEALPGEVGPGNAVIIRYRAEERTALITAFGEPGKRAERVAQEGAREAKQFARSRAPIDPHLADQLLLPLALGPGGAFLASAVTEHTRTQAEVIRRFLGLEVRIAMERPDAFRIEVPSRQTRDRSDEQGITGAEL